MSDLTPRQERFIQEYLVDLSATQAAIRAGYSEHTATAIAWELLRNPEVEAAIAEAQTKRGEKVEFTAFDVFKRWATIATADPNELVQHRRAPCRYCNGKDRAYQWKTPREFAEAEAAAVSAEEQAPSDAGGYGYSVNDPIDPNCPECHGDGVGHTVAADTRTLSPQARMLYAGVKQTKDGLEIKLHDQQKALENAARHLGRFQDKLEVSGKLSLEELVLGAIRKEEAEKGDHQP
jgi:phage terminase small subunit